MLQGWVVVGVAIAYIAFLFLIAIWGNQRLAADRGTNRTRLLIYPLSLAVYCTSWTFFGSVGLASREGFDFLTIYIGPILLFAVGLPLLLRIVRIAKQQNSTSIADFIGARYGKSEAVAAIVTLIAIIAVVPYIALQLQAVSASLSTVLAHLDVRPAIDLPFGVGDIAFLVAMTMALFAILFGTRQTDATEHQDGLMLAIATESVVKLFAFLVVGFFITFVMFGGPGDLLAKAMTRGDTLPALGQPLGGGTWIVMILLSFCAAILLPRQFHVTVVENHSENELRRSAWAFPLYLVLINLFVMPIALAGLLLFPVGSTDPDMFVLALPLAAGNEALALVAFVGGLSAATAMVIVDSVAVAIMASNHLVLPLLLKRREGAARSDMVPILLATRRATIAVVLALAYAYHASAGAAELASIGLLAFAAIAQLAPAFFGGLVWRRGTARGAVAGMVAGISVWAYTFLLPVFVRAGLIDPSLLAEGPLGLAFLRPEELFHIHLTPLGNGVFWSLAANIAAYGFFSLARPATPIERVQAEAFNGPRGGPIVPVFRTAATITIDDLVATVARYLGEERTRRSIEFFQAGRGRPASGQTQADIELLRHAERLLASAIGAASSRLALSLALRRQNVSPEAALELLDDASAAIHYNREVLRTALDQVDEGIAVLDRDLALVFWNGRFGELLALPAEKLQLGTTLAEVMRLGLGDDADRASRRMAGWLDASGPVLERLPARRLVLEVRANAMPDGGVVVTFSDTTAKVAASEALERRVAERTEELTRLNQALTDAKAAAEAANISKTRFLAAAGHDILQPLNAARLYAASLGETVDAPREHELAARVAASLDAVEEIIGALLEIARLDAGAQAPEITDVRLDDLFAQLEVEFAPIAAEKGLTLRFVSTRSAVRTDRRLLRRLLQNLVSNALKYTISGGVLIGCRRRAGTVRIDVVDTGLGIPDGKRTAIFEEFARLEDGARVAPGLGLGLSIVERIARVLDHSVDFVSIPGRGTRFSVEVSRSILVPQRQMTAAPLPRDHGRLDGLAALVVDNDAQIVDGMAALLGSWNATVATAPDLSGAMTALDAGFDPTVLLVDYHLDAGLDGLSVIAALRARLGPLRPAVLITAERSAEVARAARDAGVDVLTKPVRPAALRALVTRAGLARRAAE